MASARSLAPAAEAVMAQIELLQSGIDLPSLRGVPGACVGNAITNEVEHLPSGMDCQGLREVLGTGG